jgi:transposase
MTPEILFTQALQLQGSGYEVKQCTFEGEPKKLGLRLDFKAGTKFKCPQCGEVGAVHDTVEKKWRHLNFFQYECELMARVPRVKCQKDGVRQVEVPWARPGSGFTLMFEALVLLLGQEMSMKAVAEMMGEHDTLLWRLLHHHVNRAQAARNWSQVRRIQVDETSARRGHKYVTNVVDADTKELLFMVEGRSGEALEAFAAELIAHGGTAGQIEWISMDFSPAYQKGARDHFPQAKLAFDRFHLMQLAGKALDTVRKSLYREAGSKSPLKGQRWSILGNVWTRSEDQQIQRKELAKTYPKLGRALGLREMLQDILTERSPEALKWWCARAGRSKLEPFCKLAKTVRNHWDGIIGYFESGLTNAAIEAVNGNIQLAKRLARGFRNFTYFQAMAYLKAARLNVKLPNPLPT